jgi:hypothetical protein
MLTRDQIMKDFNVDERGIIQNPGKFESEMLYVPYFWDMVMEGAGEDLYFNDSSLVTIIAVSADDLKAFPELGNVTEIAIESTSQGFVIVTTGSAEIAKIRADYAKEAEAPAPATEEESIVATESANKKLVRKAADAPASFQVGDKVEFPVHWMGHDSFAQGEIASIENDVAQINLDGDAKTPEWAPLVELRKITEYSPASTAAPEDFRKMQEEGGMVETEASVIDPVTASEDARKLVIQAMGYKDIPAQIRACYLLGLAEQKIWKSAVDQIKKNHEKEMKDKVKALTKWGTVQPSDAAVKDVIAKVLQANGIYPYPNLVAAVYANPFQNRGSVVPEDPTETMSEPR